MDSGIDSFKLSSSLLEIQKRLEDLRTRCTSDTGNAAEILSDALEQLQVTFEKLSTANEALLLDEAELKLVTNNVPLLLAHVGSDLKYIFVNQPYADWFHLKRSEIIGQHISEVLSDEGYEATLGCIKQVLSGEKVDYEIVVQKESGPHVLHIDFIPQLDEHGTMQSYYTVTQDITARKWVEKELKVSRDRFRAIFDKAGMGMGIVVGDTSGCIEDCNIAFAEMLGYSKEELVQKHFKDITFSEDIDKNLDLFQQMIAGQIDRYQMEKRYIRKDGGWIWCNLATSAIRGDNGKLLQILAVVEDITERKRAEESLLENQTLLRAVMEGTSDPVYIKDRESRIILANQALANVAGRPIEEIIGRTDSEYYGDLAVGQALREHDLLVMTSGQSEVVEETVPTPYGDRTFLSSKAPYRNASGEIIGITGISRDITELKRTEETLRESEERYREIVETAEEGIATHEPDGTITYVNQRMADMLGYSREEVIGRSSLDFVDDEERKKVNQARESLKEEGSFSKERKMRRKDGSILWTLANVSPRRDSAGNFLGYLAMHTDITERKRAEEKLRESEERFRAVQENSLDRFTILKPFYDDQGKIIDFTYIYQNAQAARTAGLRPEELIGLRMSEIFPTFLQSRFFAMYKQAVETGQVTEFEERYCADGGEDWFSVTVTPIPDGIAIATQIITERKKAEEALCESEEHYRLLHDTMAQAVVYQDAEGHVVSTNQAALKILGLTAQEFLGETAFSRERYCVREDGTPFPADEHPCMVALRTGQEIHNVVMGIYNPSEERLRWINISAVPLFRRGDEKPYQVYTISDDITERKQAEEALRKLNTELEQRVSERTAELVKSGEKVKAERQRFLDMLDTLPVIIDIIRPDHQITWTNRAYREALGDNQGRPCFESQFGRNKPCDECQAFIPLDTGQPHHWEWTLPSGRTFDIYNFPFADADGSPVILEMDIDITERRKAEAALKDLNENLEMINEELQMEISEHEKTEKELLKAKEAAEEAVKVKAAFMANMSHELRTPMNSVIGFTGLLLEEPLTVEQKDYLESIRNSGQALMTLINEVLDFSKMDREKMDLEIQTFDLRNITEEALDVVAAQATNKGLELNYTFSKNVPEAIIGDPGKLRQVLSNLLGNAVKFTKYGEVEVSVSSNPDQDEIHFAVRDTGIGIREEDIEKLFQPFSQLDLSYSRGFEGTGLGLAISKKLVELMGGRIWVESAVDKGSIFHFTIPAETAPAEHKPFLTGSFEGKRVLLVEENQTLRRILGRQFHAWDIIPMMASNIVEAIELLQRDNSFDAVIIDASKDDIASVVTEKRDRWKQLPFIALTTLGQKMPQNIFQAVLSKPLKPAKLFNALKNVLEEREVSEPVEVSEMEESYGPLRILLAEDNLSNQKVTLEMLKKLGYRADAVVNGQEVLEALERQPYDIIFMDVKMPVMNGIEATMEIRKRWPENGPKIIAVTAYALHGDKEKCLAAGMDDYISKPVQKEDLAKVLGEYSIGA